MQALRSVRGELHATTHNYKKKGKVHKRATWLNGNVFGPGAIDAEAVAAMQTLPVARAMEIFKGLEEKGAQAVLNPSGYLKVAVRCRGRGRECGRGCSPRS